MILPGVTGASHRWTSAAGELKPVGADRVGIERALDRPALVLDADMPHA